MFMGLCAVAFLALAALLGGQVGRLAMLRVRFAWVIFVALALQVFVIETLPSGAVAFGILAHDLTYVAAVAVAIANRRLPGMLLLGLGTFSNGLGIVANGGTLPASRAAVVAADFHKQGHGIDNAGLVAHPHLAWLGDTFSTPPFLPLRNTMSIGDVLILLGALWLVLHATNAWPWRRRTSSGEREVEVAPSSWAVPLGLRAFDILPN